MPYLTPIMARPALYDRERAVSSAMTLFWHRGFSATSLKDLEGALRMNPGSIYAAFSSKEKLYEEAMHCYFESGLKAFRAHMAEAQSPVKGLADHIRMYAGLPLDDPRRRMCMLMKTIVETQTTVPSLSAKAHEYIVVTGSEIALVFETAKSRGEIPENSDPEYLARRYQAGIGALRFELHQNTDQTVITMMAEDMARDLEDLRVSSFRN